MTDDDYTEALERIRDQAERAMAGERPRGTKGLLLGLYGVTSKQLFLGNIAAIAATALNRKLVRR